MATQKERSKNFKIIRGKVVSAKNDKTRIILVETLIRHPLFHKSMRRSRRIKIHDERNEANVGDVVLAIETRRLSKEKRHRLHKIVERAQ